MSRLARRTDPCREPVADPECARGQGRREARRLQEDRSEPPPVLYELWQPRARSSSWFRHDRCSRGFGGRLQVPTDPACELRREGPCHARRSSEVQGLPEGVRWVGGNGFGVTWSSGTRETPHTSSAARTLAARSSWVSSYSSPATSSARALEER